MRPKSTAGSPPVKGLWAEEHAAQLASISVLRDLLVTSLRDVPLEGSVGHRIYTQLDIAEMAMRNALREWDSFRYPPEGAA